MNLLAAVFMLAISAWPRGSWANNEEFVVSLLTGANSYLVVTPGGGPSTRTLGFYTRKSDDWRPAVLGTIVLHPQRGAILHQFAVSKVDRLSLSMALVDGQLTLFSQESAPDQPKSVVRIGSQENPLLHPIIRAPLPMAPITDLSQVSFYEHQASQGASASLVFISVRTQEDRGLTFVFRLGATQGSEINVQTPLVLLSEKFMDTEELSQIARSIQGDWIPAPVVKEHLLNQIQHGLSAPYAKALSPWTNSIRSSLATHFVDINKLTLMGFSVPSFPIGTPNSTAAARLSQVIDPLNFDRCIVANGGTAVAAAYKDHGLPCIQGTVDLDSNGDPLYLRVNIPDRTGKEKFIEFISIDRHLKVMAFPSVNNVPLYSWLDMPMEKMGAAYIGSDLATGNSELHYFLFSRIDRQNQTTTSILQIQLENGKVQNLKESRLDEIAHRFFSQDDLQARVQQVTDQGRNVSYVFHVTDPPGTDPENALNLQETLKQGEIILGGSKPVDNSTDVFYVRTYTELRLVLNGTRQKHLRVFDQRPEWIEAWHKKIPHETEEGVAFHYLVLHYQTPDHPKPQIEFLVVEADENGRTSVQAFKSDSDQLAGFPASELKKRIVELKEKDESQRWVFDASPKMDRSQLFDIKKTALAQRLIEDERGKQNVAKNMQVAEVEKTFKKIFPEVPFSISPESQLTLGGNINMGAFKVVHFPSERPKENDPLRFYEVDWQGRKGKLALMSGDFGQNNGAEAIFILSVPNADGAGEEIRVYRLSFTETKINAGRIERIKVLPPLGAEGPLTILVQVEFGEKNRPVNPMALSKPQVYGLTLLPGDAGQFNPTVKLLGDADPRRDLDFYLAHTKEWLWIHEGAEDFHSKRLELHAIGRPLKLKPNESRGRALKDQITYVVPANKRPQGSLLNATFFEGSWAIAPSELVKKIAPQKAPDEFSDQLFGEVAAQIESYLQPRASYRPQVLLVPDSIRPLLMSYLADRFERASSEAAWSKANQNSRYFWLEPNKMSQYQVIDNLEVIANSNSRHNVLLADLKTLADTNPPVNEDGKSLYQDMGSLSFDDQAAERGENGIKAEERWPHLTYLLATQGDGSISYEASRKLPRELRFPLLFFGQKSEWETFTNRQNEFVNYGLEDWFDIREIHAPTLESKINLLNGIFENPKIKALGFKFNSVGLSKKSGEHTQDEAKAAVLRHAVNRVESLSKGTDKNPFSLYLQFLSLITESLIQDRTVRNSQTIDKAFVERVLTKMFNIPLNRSFLAPDDPLHIISRPDAATRLQDSGYNGPMRLRLQVVDLLKSQLSPNQAKTIPSSFILAGDTGTGKSHMFMSLVKMLNLKLYNFEPVSAAANAEANAIIIRADKLLASNSREIGSSGGGTMTVDQALMHLDQFWSLPLGYRGYIFIDDLHGAPAEVRTQLLVYLRGLFESPNGLHTTKPISFKSSSGKTIDTPEVTRPIRGVTLIAAMNFTENMEQIEKFTKKGEKPSLEQIILATLSTPNHSLESSFLRRWGAIVPLSEFSVEAKAPGLLEGFRKKMQSLLELKSRFAFLSPEFVKAIAATQPNLDARSFLNDSTNALYDLASDSEDALSALVIAPLQEDTSKPVVRPLSTEGSSKGISELQKYVFANAHLMDLGVGYEGQLHLMKMLLNSFRLAVFETLVRGAQENPAFGLSATDQRQTLYPLLHAVFDHVQQAETMPLSALNLDPTKFGLSQKEAKVKFAETLNSIDRPHADKPFFPLNFTTLENKGRAYAELTGIKQSTPSQRTRKGVLVQYAALLQTPLEQELSAHFRLDNLVTFPRPEKWIEGLRDVEVGGEKALVKRLSDLFFEFRQEVYGDDLIEVIDADRYAPMTAYALARLYLYTVDRAISRLPWGEVIQFFSRASEAVVDDMVLSQSPGFQYLLSESKRSPFRLRTNDYLLSLVSNFPAFDQEFGQLRDGQRRRFNDECSRLLQP